MLNHSKINHHHPPEPSSVSCTSWVMARSASSFYWHPTVPGQQRGCWWCLNRERHCHPWCHNCFQWHMVSVSGHSDTTVGHNNDPWNQQLYVIFHQQSIHSICLIPNSLLGGSECSPSIIVIVGYCFLVTTVYCNDRMLMMTNRVVDLMMTNKRCWMISQSLLSRQPPCCWLTARLECSQLDVVGFNPNSVG